MSGLIFECLGFWNAADDTELSKCVGELVALILDVPFLTPSAKFRICLGVNYGRQMSCCEYSSFVFFFSLIKDMSDDC